MPGRGNALQAPHIAIAIFARGLLKALVTRAYFAGEALNESDPVLAMIEDPEALDDIDAIVAVEGLDGFFIGRGDLTVAFQAPNAEAPAVKNAVEVISKAAKKAGKPVCVMVNGAAEAKPFQALGATAFIVSTDQGFLRKAASQALTEMAALKS